MALRRSQGLAPYRSQGNAAGQAALNALASNVVQEIQVLHNAGARYFVVGDTNASNNAVGVYRAYYDNAVYSGIASAGINFIPADFRTLYNYVQNNGAQFGLTNTTSAACSANGSTGPYAPIISYKCTQANWVTPNAGNTYFYADDPTLYGHKSGAVQQITADYVYSLVTAPSLISLLPENAIKMRLGTVGTIQTQSDISLERAGPSGMNAWVTGDVTSISLNNYNNFPNDPNQVISGAAGVDYKVAPGFVAGVAVYEGSLTSALGTNGNFHSTETAVSLYGAWKAGPFWGNAIGTYGAESYNVHRTVPIGISLQNNDGNTNGENWSAAAQGGYKFYNGAFSHGPISSLIYQRATVDGYTETGSAITNLNFLSQTRELLVGQFGYRVAYNFAEWQPFAEISWDHEFANTNRNVGASLTTLTQYGIYSPNYFMPAAAFGKSWGTAAGGLKLDAGSGVTVFGKFSGEFGQNSATVYGGQLGFNIAF